jgi:xylulokinase
MNVNVSDMMACGGGGSSALWREILSDVYNCSVKTVKSKEGPALGAAILASVGSGIYSSVTEACGEIVRTDKIQVPVEKRVYEYEKYYQLYRKIYPQLKSSFAELAALS